MGTTDLFRCAWRELGRRKLRTASSVSGYVLAVMILTVMASALRHSRREADAILNSTGTHFVAYAPVGGAACPECRAPWAPDPDEEGLIVYGQPTMLISFRALEAIRALPTVQDASPYLLFRFRDPESRSTFSVGGYDPKSQAAVGTTCCAATDIVGGRFPSPEEDGVAILEEAYASMKHLEAGDRIRILGVDLPVVGVVNPGIRPGKADVYVHFADARKLIEKRIGPGMIGEEANVILVEVKSSRLQEEAMRSVKKLLPGIMISTYACYRPAAQVMGMNEAAVWALTALVGLFAVALALKSQLSSVIERRREVAILKSIGWPDGSIVRQVLIESGLQALAGGILGSLIAAGVLLAAPARLLTGLGGGSMVGPWWPAFPAAVLLALLGGALAGSLPAAAAARQSPAEALRRI